MLWAISQYSSVNVFQRGIFIRSCMSVLFLSLFLELMSFYEMLYLIRVYHAYCKCSIVLVWSELFFVTLAVRGQSFRCHFKLGSLILQCFPFFPTQKYLIVRVFIWVWFIVTSWWFKLMECIFITAWCTESVTVFIVFV